MKCKHDRQVRDKAIVDARFAVLGQKIKDFKYNHFDKITVEEYHILVNMEKQLALRHK